jgi:large subunit ribosomal protein L10
LKPLLFPFFLTLWIYKKITVLSKHKLEKGVNTTPNKKNQASLTELSEKVAKAKSIIVADYSGTTVKDQVTLRSAIKQAGGEVVVAKNTIIDLAIGKGKVSDSLHGMNAAVFAYDDAVAPVKALFEFHKKNEKLVIKQGYMDEKVLSTDEVIALSKLPSKNELIAKLLMILKSPGQGFVNVLTANQRNLVYALNAVAEKK